MKWSLSLAAVLAASAAYGFVPVAQPESLTHGVQVGFRVLRPQIATPATTESVSGLAAGQAGVQVDARSGAARVITGDLSTAEALDRAATLDDYVAIAQRYVEAHEAALGVSFKDLELNRQAVLLAKDVQFLKFHVKRDGLSVQDAVVDFRFKNGQLVQVVNQTYAEATSDARPALGGLDRVAEEALVAASAEPQGEVYRVVTSKKGYQLVRVAQFAVTTQDGKRFVAQVEAATGQVFELRPTTFYLEGSATGSVYPRYYKEAAPQTAYRDLKLSYSGGTVTTDVNGKFTNAPAGAQPKLNGFDGKSVKVVTKSGTKVTASGSAADSGAWNIAWTKSGSATAYSDKDMAQSMTYFHLNKEINYVKRFISADWLNRQLTANVNLTQTCNAYWDGESINLFSAGDGCANTALISDVFYHEWGHGLDENTGGIDDDAYSEGFGDTMSLMMTHSPILGPGFMTSDGSPVRDLTVLKKYPADQGEAHSEGGIIAGAYYDLFLNLKAAHGEEQAGDELANFALKAIFTASRYTDVYDALLVIDGGHAASHGPNFCSINKAFTRHGLAKADASCR